MNTGEMEAAMEDVIQDVYAESSLAPMEAKMRTSRLFLACWDLPLVPTRWM